MTLNFVIAAILILDTIFMDRAANHLAQTSPFCDAGLLRHRSPPVWEHIIGAGDPDWPFGTAERKIARPLNIRTVSA